MTVTSRLLASIAVTAGAAAGILGARASRRYHRDMRLAHARVQTAGGEVIATAAGPIEVAAVGDGHPVLLSHGFCWVVRGSRKRRSQGATSVD
jgi:hypothetical protein